MGGTRSIILFIKNNLISLFAERFVTRKYFRFGAKVRERKIVYGLTFKTNTFLAKEIRYNRKIVGTKRFKSDVLTIR